MNLKQLSYSLLLIGIGYYYFKPAHAQIVAYRNAPGTQRPTVMQTRNGVPLVNIQTPSAAGVSRNVYSQFDIPVNGAILNNSRTDTLTQLSGWVPGNPWLAGGSARIIVNQVNSSHPSYLHGLLEVAGGRAQVVIANPSGISCNGCGFVNASRSTLTTGLPLFGSNGDLDSYRINGGQIDFEGNGLDNRNTNYTALLTHALRVNAAVHARHLVAVTGDNQVDANAVIDPNNAANTITAINTDTPGTPVAIDVSQLGGMYANKIFLTSNARGVGVNNAGSLYAAAGEIAISVDGQLLNRGVIDAGITAIDGASVRNTGRIYGDHVAISARTLRNETESMVAASQTGVIAARTRLDIGAHTIINRDHALLYTGGQMAIGGGLDHNRRASGRADLLESRSADIEVAGDADFRVRQGLLANDGFRQKTYARVEDMKVVDSKRMFFYTQAGTTYQSGQAERRKSDNLLKLFVHANGSYHNDYTMYDYVRTTYESEVITTDPARLSIGGDFRLDTDTFINDKSQIVVGGTLTATPDSLHNHEVKGVRVIKENGFSEIHWTERKRGRSRDDKWAKTHFNKEVSRTDIDNNIGTVRQQTSPFIGKVTEARTVAMPVVLPDNSVYHVNHSGDSKTLIQLDPKFNDQRTWLSSDYYLQRLKLDPATMQKRLGDGFYEQKLMREQVAQLTGRRFLDGYRDDHAQYQALLDNGVTLVQQWQIQPGVALSKAQMAQLTSDVVLLVTRNVTLADGQQQAVLVPQLYVRLRPGDIDGNGTLLSADTLNINATGDIVNNGTLAGRTLVSLTADNLHNPGGRVSGNMAQLLARQDINNLGGSIDAVQQLKLAAGRDLNHKSSTRSDDGSDADSRYTVLNRVAGLYVSDPAGLLHAGAGRDVNADGARIDSKGDAIVTAGRDFNSGVVTETSEKTYRWADDKGGSNMVSTLTGPNFADQANGAHGTTEAGINRSRRFAREDFTTSLNANNLTLDAGRDLRTKGTQALADSILSLTARRDINIGSASSGASNHDQRQYSESGILTARTTQTDDSVNHTTSIGSTLSAERTRVSAGNNLNVTGSDVVSGSGTVLDAGNEIAISAATDSITQRHFRKETTSGLLYSGGIGATVGSRMQSNDSTHDATRAAAAMVGSTDGNVRMTAGKSYTQTGSKVLAPKGDITVTAQTVDILAATDTERNTQESKTRQQGVTVQLTNPVISAIQSMMHLQETKKKTKNKRSQALADAATALTAANAAAAVAGSAAPAGGFDLAFSLGASSNTNSTVQSSTTAVRSQVASGGTTTIAAKGAEQKSNLTVRASDVSGDNVDLSADNQLNLLAGKNTNEEHSRNKGGSASIGFSIGTSGFMVNASASGSRGKGDGSDSDHDNTRVTATNKLAMTSGGDTNVRGGTASGKQVSAKVGGDLNIESLQDSSFYKSQQQSLGGSISVGAGKVSGSINAANSRVSGNYQSVIEQSGILAGDDGFDIKVAGNTDLKGGKIASSDKAIQNGKNKLSTATLTTSDIQNQSSYKAESQSISVGGGYSGGNSAANGTGIGIASESDSAGSVTRSGISDGDLQITDTAAQQVRTGKNADQILAGLNKDVSSDKDSSASLVKTWNGRELHEDVMAQAQIMEAFSKEAAKGIGTYATMKLDDLNKQITAEPDPQKKQQLQADANKWEEGGAYRTAMHAAAAALGGGIAGAVGATASSLAMPIITEQIDKMDTPLVIRNGLAQVAAAALGVAVGGSVAMSSAVSVEANNRQLHEEDKKNAKRMAALAKEQGLQHTEADILGALQHSGVRDESANIKVKAGTQETYINGKPLNNGSATMPLTDNQKQNAPFAVDCQGGSCTERLPQAPARDLKNFITDNASGYFFNADVETISTVPHIPQKFPCATAECAAGLGPNRRGSPPDYLSAQLGFYVLNAGIAVNLHNGETFGGINFGRDYPRYASTPGLSITAGRITGNADGKATSAFLTGANTQVSTFFPIPFAPWIGAGGGVNHSYGGATAIEGGLSIPPGSAFSPAGYSKKIEEDSKK